MIQDLQVLSHSRARFGFLPTMHGDEQKWVDEAIQTNWVSTVGANINEVEKQVDDKVGRKYAVALSSGTVALHLAMKLCGEKLYGQP